MANTLDMKLLLGYNGAPLDMMSDKELVYSVANSGVILDLETGVRQYIGGEARPIGPIAVHPKRIMLVIGEEGEHAAIRVLTLPQMSKVQHVQKVGTGKISDIQFARDGNHVVVLASIPTFMLTVFTVKASTRSLTQLVQVDASQYQPRAAMFSPFSSDDIMAIGNGHVVFWKYERAQGSAALVPTEGKPQGQVKVTCGMHTTQNGIVLCGTSTGDIYEFDSTVGAGVPWWESPGGTSSPVASIVLSRHHVVSVSQDGILRFYRTDSHVIERSITLSSSAVTTMVMAGQFDTFFVGGRDGIIQSVVLPGYNHLQLKPDEFRDIVDEGSVWNDYSGGAYCGIVQLKRPDKAGKDPNLAVTVATDCTLRVWDYAGNSLQAKVPCGIKPTTIAHGAGSFVVVGSQTSHLRFFDLSQVTQPRLASQHMLSDKPGTKITRLAVCPYRQRMAVNVEGVGIYFSSSASDFEMVGYLPVDGHIADVLWADAETVMFANNTGDVRCAQFPQKESEEASRELPKSLLTYFWRLELPAERIIVTEDTPEAYTIVAHSRDKCIKTYSLDKSVRQTDAAKIPIKKPVSQLKASEALGTDLIVQNGTIYASHKDGRVEIRDVLSRPNDGPKLSAMHHRCLFGGCVGLILNGKKLVSAGGDGVLSVYNLEGQSSEILANSPFTIAQGAQMGEHPEVQEEESTYLVRVADERHKLLQMKHEPYRKALMGKIAALRERLQEYKTINTNAAAEEKLETQAFMIESQRREIQELGERLQQEKVEEIKWCNLARDYLADGIKKNCWNSMNTHLKILKGIAPNPNINPQITVSNYSIRQVKEKDNVLLRKMRFLREVEQLEWKRRKGFEALDDLTTQEVGDDGEPVAKKDAEEEDEEVQEDDGEDAPKPLTAAEEAQLSVNPLLYNKFMTYTRSRAMTQIKLLQQEIYVKQREFNEKVEASMKRKAQDVALIAEKNIRIQQIHKELEVDDDILVPRKIASEHPEKVLEVTDGEIAARVGARKEEGKEEGVKMADEEEEGYLRALKIMMDNRLERDERVVVEIKLPAFADESNKEAYRPREEWTDEEQKAFKDYQKKLQKRQEEEEKHRKGLQAELKDLRAEVQGIITEYEGSLQQLFNTKLDTDTQICQMDLEIIKLCQAQVQQEEMETHYKKLVQIVDNVRKETDKANGLAGESLRVLQAKRDECEELARNERNKLGDKEIRNQPPFSENEEYCDMLIKILRKSLKPKKDKVKKDRDDKDKKKKGEDNPDPFSFIEEEEEEKRIAAAKKAQQSVAETDVKLDRPDGLRDDVWREFLDFRRERLEAEKEQKVLVDELQDLQRNNDRLTRDAKAHSANLDEKERLLREFKLQMVREGYNLDVLHTFKQGKIEVEQEAVVTDYDDAILIHKDRIEELNVQIREHGRAKVDKMMEIMQFKKGIRLIEWENQVLSHEVKFCEMEHKHLHTLRVTKAVQEFIKGGAENHHDVERERIMKKIEHVRSTMQSKIDEKKQQMQKIKRVIKEKQQENAELEAQVKNATQIVSQREEIYNLQSTGLDNERNAKLMKNMRVTRKLEDVAKAQQEEMKLLKKEIDRLRERTFPSFAVVSKRVVGNPDETGR